MLSGTCQGKRGALAALHGPFHTVAPTELAAAGQVSPTEPPGQLSTPSPVAIGNSSAICVMSPQVTVQASGEGTEGRKAWAIMLEAQGPGFTILPQIHSVRLIYKQNYWPHFPDEETSLAR